MKSDSSGKIDTSSPGSPQAGEPGFLAIGLLGKPHGVKGEINLHVSSNQIEDILSLKSVSIGDIQEEFSIRYIRRKGEHLLISFEGISTPGSATHLRNKIVYIQIKDAPVLKNDSYYYHQLIGIQVINRKGELLGKISEILKTGANDVYVITSPNPPAKEILIPAIKSVILEVDLAKKRMVVDSQEWD